MNKKLVILLVSGLLIGGIGYGFINETRTVPLTVNYTVTEKESYQVPYQEAVYKTVDKTVYANELQGRMKTETVTKYKTLYSGTVGGYTITRAISYNKVYTGESFWGYSEYTVTVCWSTCNDYHRVRSYNIELTPEEVPYTENVQVPYEVTVSVPKITQEEVIDRYDTKYKIEYKDVVKQKQRIDYVNVTKTKFRWLFE